MKSVLFFRRSALLALLFAVSLTACKKSNSDPAPAPDIADRVAGQYNFSELSAGGQTIPASKTNLKGGIVITRQTATTVSIQVALSLKSTGEAYLEDSVDDVTVTEASGGTVEYSLDGDVIARSNGNKISIDGEDADGEEFTISATK
jgi:lipopolysaccharide export system protein LptA